MDDAAQTRLDDLMFMLGDDAGRLAFALDRITDAMALAAQHGVRCRTDRGEATRDVGMIVAALGEAKALVQASIQTLRQDRG